MGRFKTALCGAAACVGLASGGATAQTAGDASLGTFSIPGLQLAVGQKAWFTSWDTRLLDANVVLPSPTSPPVLQTFASSRVVDRVLPITSFSAKYDNVVFGGTVTPTMRYSDDAANTGSVSRSEYDVNIGYAFSPYLSASLVYKGGRLSQITSANFTRLLGVSSDATLKGFLIGLSGNAPVAEGLKLYGTLAFGPGRESTRFQTDTHSRIVYSIGESGLSYVLPFDSAIPIVVNAGYRIQVITIKDVSEGTYSTTGALLSSSKQNLNTTTHGPVLGITIVF